ncbi:hypothetical protein L1887_15072 [Cichorium endivia]|nr:hypothetical protein L1887_15072 [Cichorium endivia]
MGLPQEPTLVVAIFDFYNLEALHTRFKNTDIEKESLTGFLCFIIKESILIGERDSGFVFNRNDAEIS